MSKLPLKNNCFVSSITLTALNKLGQESLLYEPEILRDAFEAEFGISKLSQKLFDKLNCGYMLVGTDMFTSTIEGFLTATAIMNNMVFDDSEIPYCTLEQCAWGVWEYMNLLGDMKDGKPTDTFSSDIIAYIRAAGRANGITKFPEWLSFAEDNNSVPDLSGDVSLFEMYQARQFDYIEDINTAVNNKQTALVSELTLLNKEGFIG